MKLTDTGSLVIENESLHPKVIICRMYISALSFFLLHLLSFFNVVNVIITKKVISLSADSSTFFFEKRDSPSMILGEF